MQFEVTDVKTFYDAAYEADHPVNYGGSIESFGPRGQELEKILMSWMEKCQVPKDASVLEVGCGMGYLNKCHKNWRGVEYSSTAVRRAKEMFGQDLRIHQGDARQLPVETGSVDFLFSFATMEHIPDVEVAFEEIDRVLRPGGAALIAAAWNCRPWTVKKLQIRPYSDLSLGDKLVKALVPIRNHLVWRTLFILPGRIKRELLLFFGRKCSLDYRKMFPDLSLNERFPHISDDDAFVSMDAHAALAYYVSRGWKSVSHPGFFRRIMIRGEEIVVLKSN